MPELPEVETVKRGIRPHIIGRCITAAIVREHRFRLPAPKNLNQLTRGKKILEVRRRGKYIIIDLDKGALIIHLGMSGIVYFALSPPDKKHEHIALQIDDKFLIYKDPRRFGCFVYCTDSADTHPLLQKIGCEPLSAKFNGIVLQKLMKRRQSPIKTALLNGELVAGIGNIYASESLHLAGISPQMPAAEIDKTRAICLAKAIKTTLRRAIVAGGSTIRDFAQPGGESGYFQTQWQVYSRNGQLCKCGGVIKKIVQSGRSTYYCPKCQHK